METSLKNSALSNHLEFSFVNSKRERDWMYAALRDSAYNKYLTLTDKGRRGLVTKSDYKKNFMSNVVGVKKFSDVAACAQDCLGAQAAVDFHTVKFKGFDMQSPALIDHHTANVFFYLIWGVIGEQVRRLDAKLEAAAVSIEAEIKAKATPWKP